MPYFHLIIYTANSYFISGFPNAIMVPVQNAHGIDSFVIADFARVGRISIQPWRGAQYLALQRLTRHHLHITACIAREKTYMLNNIFLKLSEFTLLDNEHHPFSDKYGATAEAVLTKYISTEKLVNASIEELITFVTEHSRGRITNPEQTAALLQQAAKSSYRLFIQ